MAKTILIIAAFLVTSCGVKGDPLPPETPPLIGRGEPDFSMANPQKKKKKVIRDEWDKEEDFKDDDEK